MSPHLKIKFCIICNIYVQYTTPVCKDSTIIDLGLANVSEKKLLLLFWFYCICFLINAVIERSNQLYSYKVKPLGKS
jgi:hypothetical protein